MKRLLVISLLFTAMVSFAQQVTVSTDTTTYLIGDYIRVQLQANAPAGTTITFPQADLMDPELEVISVNPPDSIPGSTGIRQEMVFSVYDSGTYRVPQLPFVFTSKNSTDTIYSDSLLFRVNTLEVDTTAAIKPIKDNLEVSYRDLRWLYYAGGGLLLLVIAAATIWYLRKRKQQKAAAPVILRTKLSTYTLEQLQQLDAEQLWQQGQIKSYYSGLTDILRRYIEQRFGFPAMERTSDEILELLRGAQTAAPDEIFRLADMAKFAKSRPLPDQNKRAMELAVQWVTETTPDNEPEMDLPG